MDMNCIKQNILAEPEVKIEFTTIPGYSSGYHFKVNGITISSQCGAVNYHYERNVYKMGEVPMHFWSDSQHSECAVWDYNTDGVYPIINVDEDALIAAIIQAQQNESVEEIYDTFHAKGFKSEWKYRDV